MDRFNPSSVTLALEFQLLKFFLGKKTASQTGLWDFTRTIQKAKPCALIPSYLLGGRAGLSPHRAG